MSSTAGAGAAGFSVVGKKRHGSDFYPTPHGVTQSLVDFYKPILTGKRFHEGSCGDGAISRVLEANGLDVVSTDIVPRSGDLFTPAYADALVDFLKINPSEYACGTFSTIQNPPFSHWVEFVRKCHELGMPFIAMFGKQQVWNARARLQLWRDHPPKAVHPLSWRPDFDGRGAPTMDCC